MVDLPLSGSKNAHCHMGWDFIKRVVAQKGEKVTQEMYPPVSFQVVLVPATCFPT